MFRSVGLPQRLISDLQTFDGVLTVPELAQTYFVHATVRSDLSGTDDVQKPVTLHELV